MVIHDETVDRTTDGRGAVKDYTLSELRRLDASGRFTGLFGVQHIPTLREYFDYIRSFSIFTNIELKNSEYYYEGLEEKTITLIREYHLEDRILFSSFNNASVLFCRNSPRKFPEAFSAQIPFKTAAPTPFLAVPLISTRNTAAFLRLRLMIATKGESA